MASQKRNPAPRDGSEASKIDHAFRLIAIEDSETLSEIQALRIAGYTVTSDLMVEHFRYE